MQMEKIGKKRIMQQKLRVNRKSCCVQERDLVVFVLRFEHFFYLWQKNNYFNYACTQDGQQH